MDPLILFILSTIIMLSSTKKALNVPNFKLMSAKELREIRSNQKETFQSNGIIISESSKSKIRQVF